VLCTVHECGTARGDLTRSAGWRVSSQAKKYLGFVDCADIALLTLFRGLRRRKPDTFVGRLSELLKKDTDHQGE
jgi:hypothetical protein